MIKTMNKYYYFDVTKYTATGFTTTDEAREWLLSDSCFRITGLATYLLYYNQDYVPPVLQSVPIIPEPTMNREKCLPDGVLPDYLSFGSYYFVSPRLKELFDRHHIAAFYSDAYLEMDSERHPYHLFAPTKAVDAIDREQSEYTEEPEDGISIRINKIKKLVLDNTKIPANTPLFQLGGTVKRIYLLRGDIAEELKTAGINGMVIEPVEDGQWVY